MSVPTLWHRFDGPIDETSAAAIHLLDALDVDAAPQSVAGYINAHPSFPSLAAIVDCLEELGVKASTRRSDVAGLTASPPPYLIHVRDAAPTGAFWVVEAFTAERFMCRDSSGASHALSASELESRFLGVVLRPTVHPGAGERDAARHRLGDRLRQQQTRLASVLLALTLFGTLLTALRAPSDLQPWAGLHLVCAWVGLVVSGILSLKSHVNGGRWLERLCPTGATWSCNVVTESKASRIAGVIPLADLGVAFFAAEVLTSAVAHLAGWSRPHLFLELVATVSLLPFTLYAIGVQALVLKRWCALCLIVQAMIWAELVIALAAVGLRPELLAELDVVAVGVLGSVALGVALLHALVRPLLTPAALAPGLVQGLERYRNVNELLARELAQSPVVSTDVQGKLRTGADDAPIEVLVVSHPFCVACADAHEKLSRLVGSFPKLVRAATIFSVGGSDAKPRSAARNLLAGNIALDVWYAEVEKNAEAWVTRSELDAIAPEAEATLSAQTQLATANGVDATPTIFVDGRRLPSGFTLKHLRFYLRAQEKRRAQQARDANGATA